MSREEPTPRCPHCDSGDVTRVAYFGTSAAQSQWHCAGCGSVFEFWRYGGPLSPQGGK